MKLIAKDREQFPLDLRDKLLSGSVNADRENVEDFHQFRVCIRCSDADALRVCIESDVLGLKLLYQAGIGHGVGPACSGLMGEYERRSKVFRIESSNYGAVSTKDINEPLKAETRAPYWEVVAYKCVHGVSICLLYNWLNSATCVSAPAWLARTARATIARTEAP